MPRSLRSYRERLIEPTSTALIPQSLLPWFHAVKRILGYCKEQEAKRFKGGELKID